MESCKKCKDGLNPVFDTLIRCSRCTGLLHVHCTTLQNAENSRKMGLLGRKATWKCEFCIKEMIMEEDTNTEPKIMSDALRDIQLLLHNVSDIQHNIIDRIEKRLTDIENQLDKVNSVEDSLQFCSDKINDISQILGPLSDDVLNIKKENETVLQAKFKEEESIRETVGDIQLLQQEVTDIKLHMKKLNEVERIYKRISDIETELDKTNSIEASIQLYSDKIKDINQELESLGEDIGYIKKENEVFKFKGKEDDSKMSEAFGDIQSLQQEVCDIKLVLKKLQEIDRIGKKMLDIENKLKDKIDCIETSIKFCSDKIKDLNKVLEPISDDVGYLKQENQVLKRNCKDLDKKLLDYERKVNQKFRSADYKIFFFTFLVNICIFIYMNLDTFVLKIESFGE